MFTHEDERRTLIEWATGNFKECKVAIMKQDGVLGNHWHANKDETFLLLSGKAKKVAIGGEEWLDLDGPKVFHVPRHTRHSFYLEKGAILLGAASELYDVHDERLDIMSADGYIDIYA